MNKDTFQQQITINTFHAIAVFKPERRPVLINQLFMYLTLFAKCSKNKRLRSKCHYFCVFVQKSSFPNTNHIMILSFFYIILQIFFVHRKNCLYQLLIFLYRAAKRVFVYYSVFKYFETKISTKLIWCSYLKIIKSFSINEIFKVLLKLQWN